MAIKRVPIGVLVNYLAWCYENKCGYIMGAYGQNPRTWSKTSWWFTQYKGDQLKKALYWRENAPLVHDCNGLAEGGYQAETGVNINARSRDNYATWCNPKGSGRIPSRYRVPGAAVFINNGSYVSHVGYLWKPVVANKPGGDWWVIEARGVMYGCVKSRLYTRSFNRWGWMTKYFNYDDAGAGNEPETPEFGHRTLAMGDTGDDVKALQEALITLGFSGAWIGNLTALEPYRPILIGVALVALFFAWRRIFRPARACAPDDACAVPQVRTAYKVIFWIVTALVLIALVFPYLMPLFY